MNPADNLLAHPITTAELNVGRHKLASVPAKLATHAQPHPTSRHGLQANAATGSDQHLPSAVLYLGAPTVAVGHPHVQSTVKRKTSQQLPMDTTTVSSSSSSCSSMSSAKTTSGPMMRVPRQGGSGLLQPDIGGSTPMSNCSSAFSSSSSSGYGTSAASPPNSSLMLGSY
jgi:hypothetical protein